MAYASSSSARLRMTGGTRSPYPTDNGKMDAISISFTLLSFVVAGFVIVNFTFIDSDLASAYNTLTFLAVVGLMIHYFLSFNVAVHRLPANERIAVIMGGLLAFIMVGFVAFLIEWRMALYPFAENVTDWNKRIFYVVAAVDEELFFCFGLYSALINLSMMRFSPYIMNIPASLVFVLYHWSVYGTYGNVLLLLFIGRFFMNLAYFYTQRISTSMIAHVLINISASFGV